MGDFTAEPLAVAERIVRHRRRRFIDFAAFMEHDWEKHDLIIGSFENAYDRCHHIALWDHKHEPYPLHQIARPYLEECIRLQGHVPQIYDQQLLERQPPLYFAGPHSGEYACVDLNAAYWQLYRVASLDLQYDGTSHPRQGKVRFLGADELRPHKLLRNAVIGAIRAERRTESHYGTVELVDVGPELRRPCLWAWVMDTLEAVAWEARMLFGAIHVQVDGYIIKATEATDLVEFLSSEWGLEASIRAVGEGTITGLGHWHIADIDKGADAEEGFTEPHRAGLERIDNMTKRDWSWLREWYRDALEYKNATPEIKLLDNRMCPW